MTVSSLLRTGAVAAALTVAAGGTVLVTAGAGSAENKTTGGSGRTLTTVLNGANEVPSPTTGDPDGTGTATITINRGQGELCFNLAWQNIGRLAAAHIHEAAAGSNGPVVLGFPASTFTPGVATACLPLEGGAALDPELLKDLITDPSDYYVNFHTAEFPGGAIRGQLSK